MPCREQAPDRSRVRCSRMAYRRSAWGVGATLLGLALIVTLSRNAGEARTEAATADPFRPHGLAPGPGSQLDLTATDRLPDLDQEPPSELEVRVRASAGGLPTHRLGFRSAVRNIGAGPLIVDASRPNPSTPTMTVNQLIERTGGPQRVVPGVGRMEYAESPDHSHWHYLQFERYELQRYELRPAGGGGPIVTDRKSGFCLGDRYRVTTLELAAAPVEPVYRGRCGLRRYDLLHMREGISVGYGDDYAAFLEG